MRQKVEPRKIVKGAEARKPGWFRCGRQAGTTHAQFEIILTKMLSELELPGLSGVRWKKMVEREKGKFSVIMADWNMPEMNGLELVKRVRSVGVLPPFRS